MKIEHKRGIMELGARFLHYFKKYGVPVHQNSPQRGRHFEKHMNPSAELLEHRTLKVQPKIG